MGVEKRLKQSKNGQKRDIIEKHAKKTCFITYFYFSDTQRVTMYLGKTLKKQVKNICKKTCVIKKVVVTLHSQNGNGVSIATRNRKEFCEERTLKYLQ